MAITKVSPDVVNFDSALVVSPTLTIGDATAEDTKIVFDGNAQDYYIGLDDSADDLIIGLGSTVGTTPAIIIDENLNIGIGATPNYGKVNITTTGTGAQDRALWVECSPASSGSNNNAMVVNVGNGNMTNTVMRIHHESPAANQKLLSLDTTGSNTEKFWVDEDGDAYLAGQLGIGVTPDALLHVKHGGGGFDEVARLTSVADSSGDGAFLGFHGNSTSKFYGFIGGYDIGTNQGGVKIGVGNGETAISDDMTKMTIDNNGGVTMTRADNGVVLALKSTDNDADSGPILDFFRDPSDGVNANGDKIGKIRWMANDTVGQSTLYFQVEGVINQADNGAEDGSLEFYSLYNGTKTLAMKVGGSGGAKSYFGPSVADMGGYLNSANAGLAIGFANDQGYYRRIYAHTNSSSMELRFWNGVNEGRLTTGGVWTDASDVNLKKDIVDIEYGLETVKKLKPRKYKMKANDEEQIGFIAQEVETEIPEVVGAGENPDGVIQKNLSYGQLTAVLTKAIQEQQTLIENLQAEVKALKEA